MKYFSNQLSVILKSEGYTIKSMYIGKHNHQAYAYFHVLGCEGDECRFDFYNSEKGITLHNIDGVCMNMNIIIEFMCEFNTNITNQVMNACCVKDI
jgi:hypothetical protein